MIQSTEIIEFVCFAMKTNLKVLKLFPRETPISTILLACYRFLWYSQKVSSLESTYIEIFKIKGVAFVFKIIQKNVLNRSLKKQSYIS